MAAALYAHEVSGQARRRTEVATDRMRADVRGSGTNRVIVRGRATRTGAIVWDVLKILGKRTEAYALGCVWQEEAIALAQQCLSGRVFVSFHGVRALLKPDFRTPVRDVGPDRQVALTARDGKPITESREIEVRPR